MTWLLVRGLSRDQRHWGDFPATLEAALGEPVLTVDPPGFGEEHLRRSPTTIEAITDDIRERVADRLPAGERWSLLGISLGGMVTLDWCARHPAELDRAVVVNTSTRLSPTVKRFRPGAVPALLAARLRSGPAAERPSIAVSLNRPDHDLDALAATYARWAGEKPASGASVRAQVTAARAFRAPAAVTVPLLVLASQGDRLVDPSCSERIAAHLGAPLVVHPDGGHDLALDAPDWIAQQVLAPT